MREHARGLNVVQKNDLRGFVVRTGQAADDPSGLSLLSSPEGHQPCLYQHPGGGLAIVCVGHLYARSATTFSLSGSLGILASRYLEAGMDGLTDAIGGGMYGLFVIDLAGQRLHALSDFMACMPIFHKQASGAHLVGINQFDLGLPDELDAPAAWEYLAYGYLPFSQSVFKGVRRLGPGQVLTIALDGARAPTGHSGPDGRETWMEPGSHLLSAVRLPVYPAPDARTSDETEAVDRVHSLFTRFFGRLGGEVLASGLSGGYDSRLIAAYCAGKNLKPVTYDNPGTNEADFACRAAEALGRATTIHRVPDDAPSRFADDFVYGAPLVDSLESSHVFANLAALRSFSPDYILDGHIGDVVLGGGFFCKPKFRIEPLRRYLLGLDTYQAPMPDDEVYLARMASGYSRKAGGLPDEIVERVDEASRAGFKKMLALCRPSCHSDADLMELLLHWFRGALLASSGPVSFLRRTPTLCPFYDRDIFTTCMAVSKSLRAGDRLYNALYRRHFPWLAGIPKESTGGNARQTVTAYRLAHLGTAAYRKLSKLLPARQSTEGPAGSRAGGNTNDFLERYLANDSNRIFFDRVIERSSDRLAGLGLPSGAEIRHQDHGKELYLRYVSLGLALEGGPR